MFEQIVLNASPLIVLGKADLLQTISPLAKTWLIPEGVIQEVEFKRSIDSFLTDLDSQAEASRKKIKAIHPSVAAWDLGQGESEVLTLALNTPPAPAVLDDLQARKCATVLNIPLSGSLGLLLAAKRQGLIPLARPVIERVKSVGLYVAPNVVERILHAVGE